MKSKDRFLLNKGLPFLIFFVLLISAGCTTKTSLIKAIENSDLAGINKLLDEGANIDEPSTGKWSASPLYWATYFCMPDAAQLLLKRGAGVSAPGPDGGTLLMAATACPDEMDPVVKLLIEKGNKINVQDSYYGYTPLISAASNNSSAIVKRLIKGGADINTKSKEGKTALDYARYYDSKKVIDILNPGDPALQAKNEAQGEGVTEFQKTAAAGDATVASVTLIPETPPSAVKTEGGAAPGEKATTEPIPPSKPRLTRKNVPPSGYTLENEPVVSSLTKGEFELAFAHADGLYKRTLESGGTKQNKYLALLERGKVALAARKFDQSIADLQEAEKRFLTIEGTISFTEGFGSILTDDTAMEYEAEMHEKLMISPYLIIAYLSTGDLNGAIVERNRTITKINQYIEEKPDERGYLENPFARYLTAIMYEMEDKKDDAKIEYKKLKLDHEINRIDSKKGTTTDLVILVDVGLAPQKIQEKWGPMPIPGVGVVGFAYAEYVPTPTEVTTCNIYLNGESIGSAKLLYDLENTVITQYDKNKPALQSKIVARMTAKATTQFAAKMAAKEVLKNIPFASLFANLAIDAAGAAWMAAEKADLRGWLSLPKQIKYLRVEGLEPGEHTIKIDYGCGVETTTVKVEKDKINIANFTYAK